MVLSEIEILVYLPLLKTLEFKMLLYEMAKNQNTVGGYIGYYNDGLTVNSKSNPKYIAGGILGHGGRTTNMTLDNVTIKNLNVCGITAGGVVGHIDDDTSCLNISNTNVITDTTPIRCRIQSTGESADKKYTKSSGGFVGKEFSKAKNFNN